MAFVLSRFMVKNFDTDPYMCHIPLQDKPDPEGADALAGFWGSDALSRRGNTFAVGRRVSSSWAGIGSVGVIEVFTQFLDLDNECLSQPSGSLLPTRSLH